MNKYIYILMSDSDGTLRSIDYPIGYAVETEEEAKKWSKDYKYGYTNSYMKIEVSLLENIIGKLWKK